MTAPTVRPEPKRLFVRTYGCQMNVYDSERMADLLRPIGYAPTDAPERADMVLVNTCHIREKASEKTFSELGRLKVLKDERRAAGSDLTIAVAGCVAQAEGAEISRRQPAVDIVVGPQAYHRLPELVARAERAHHAARAAGRRLPGAGVLDTEFPPEPKFDHLPPPTEVKAGSAFLAIQEGCDKFCAFCVVPYTRGAEYSRPAAHILAEARGLLDAGAVELTLLGQNVNAWRGAAPGGGEWGFARLLHALADLPGLARLRYTTSHPRDMDAALIAAHGEIESLMPYLHLPVQSGSDAILEAMNRQHDRNLFFDIVARLRAVRPDIALSSDFIVGFPGESERDFEDTMDLVRRVGFAQAYTFKYSPRPGTPASALPGAIPAAEKDRRLYALQALLREQQAVFNRSCAGLTAPVLFAEPGRKPGQLIGKTPWLQSVYAPADPRLIGRIVDVHLLEGYANSLSGEVVYGAWSSTAGAAAAPSEAAA